MRSLFPLASVTHKSAACSDNSVLITDLDGGVLQQPSRSKKKSRLRQLRPPLWSAAMLSTKFGLRCSMNVPIYQLSRISDLLESTLFNGTRQGSGIFHHR
ncbi:UNVERIFIED_CONTAM: hypothetical protein Slati_1332400 [Sesamum latifolium]|uniref:Uncharacterized protein n=1 Tax=Sesamum latifolium TaxID=2727402 RepID=A0AAW2XIB6_9LAMI